MPTDPGSVRLGKHLGVVEDPRTLQFRRYAAMGRAQLAKVPKTIAVTNKVASWPMLLNDLHADCTCAAEGHGLIARSTREGHAISLTDQDVMDLYGRVNGGRDEGAYMLDVLNEMYKTGMAGHRIGAFMRVDLKNWAHVKAACWLFGGVYLGLALPVSAQGQKVWDVPKTGKTGDGAPGSWGGHAVEVLWMTDTRATCVTWASKQPMTREFVQAYGDEAYAVLSPEWLGRDEKSPQGFNLDRLKQDLAAL